MNNQPIFPPKSDGQLMEFGEAMQYFELLPATEQERILSLLQAVIDAIKAGAL